MTSTLQSAVAPATLHPYALVNAYHALGSEIPGPSSNDHILVFPNVASAQNLLEEIFVTFQHAGIAIKRVPETYLAPLKNQQFTELCTDVYYELLRRDQDSALRVDGREPEPWVFITDDFRPGRSQARKRLAVLSADVFNELASEVLFELLRRYPSLGAYGPTSPYQNPPSRTVDSYEGHIFGIESVTDSDFDREGRLEAARVIYDMTSTENDIQEKSRTTALHPLHTSWPEDISFLTEDDEPLTSHTDDSFLPDMVTDASEEELELELAKRRSDDSLGHIEDDTIITSKEDSIPTLPTATEDHTLLPAPHLPEPFSRQSILCLDGRITCQSKHVVVSGGYADIWTGTLGKQTVAIKTMRAFSSIGTPIQKVKLLKRLWREYLAWSSLSHPNILECLGFSYDFTPESKYEIPSLISYWMSNGTVLSYIKIKTDVDLLSLVVGIAKGLSYLHTRDPTIVHGDLRAGNILVSDEGVPYLTDFGLSRILEENGGMTTSSEAAGSLRWMSPELLHADKASETSDVWAYGMTVLEIMSRKRPYHEFNLEPVVLRQIIDGRTPSRPACDNYPAVLTDKLWAICQQCWVAQPTQRPSMREVTLELMAELHEQRSRDWHSSRSPTPTSPGRTSPASAPSRSIRSSWEEYKHKKKVTRRKSSSRWEF